MEEAFIILHDCKYGPGLESHILVAERDYTYIDFAVKYRLWDGNITKDTILCDTEKEANDIIKWYMVSAVEGVDIKKELESFKVLKVEIPSPIKS